MVCSIEKISTEGKFDWRAREGREKKRHSVTISVELPNVLCTPPLSFKSVILKGGLGTVSHLSCLF